MAYKDPNPSPYGNPSAAELAVDPVQAKIDRVFSELAREMGLSDAELMLSGSPQAEEWTLVYDKFSAPRR